MIIITSSTFTTIIYTLIQDNLNEEDEPQVGQETVNDGVHMKHNDINEQSQQPLKNIQD